MRVLLQRLEDCEKIGISNKVDHVIIERQGLPRMIISEHIGKLSIYQGAKVIYSEDIPEEVTQKGVPISPHRSAGEEGVG